MGFLKNKKIGILLSYIFFALSAVIGIFISSFAIKSVGNDDYGVYQSMIAFVEYLVLLEFGIGTIMSRNISILKKDGTEEEKIRRNIATLWTLTLFLAFLLSVFSFFFYLAIPHIYSRSMSEEQILLGKRIFIFAAISLICTFGQQSLNGIIIGNEFYSFEKLVAIIKLIIRTIFVILFLTISKQVWFIAIIDATMSFALLLISYVFIKTKIKYGYNIRFFDIKILKSVLPLCFALFLQAIVNTVNGSVDKFLISIMMKPEDVTIYSIVMAMYSMFSSIATIPISIFMPQIAKSISEGRKGRNLTDTLIQPCRLSILITGLVAFGFLSVGKQFIYLVYGADFSAVWLCSIVIIFPIFFDMSNGVIINVVTVLNKQHIRSILLMLTTSLNIVLTIFGIKVLGLLGAAASTGIAISIQFFLMNFFYHKVIDISIVHLFKRAFSGILVPLLISSLLSFVTGLFIKNNFVSFFLCGFIFLLFFSLFFLIWGTNDYEKDFLKRLFGRLMQK